MSLGDSRGLGWRVDLGPGDPWSCQHSLNPYISIGDRAEGAENKTSDKVSHGRGLGNSSSDGGKSHSSTPPEGPALLSRMTQLSLQCAKGRDGVPADADAVQIG